MTRTSATTNYLELMFDALNADIGIVLETNSVERLRHKLYKIRKDHEPTFDNLAFIVSPTEPSSQLWIVKKTHAKDG